MKIDITRTTNRHAHAVNANQETCWACHGGNAWGSIALPHAPRHCINRVIDTLRTGHVSGVQVMLVTSLTTHDATNV